MKRFLFLLLLLPMSSWAVVWNANTDYVWNVGTGNVSMFPGAGSGNVWASGVKSPSSMGPTWSTTKQLPFNPSPSVTGKAVFRPNAIARGMLNPTSALITLAGAALIDQLLNQTCTRVFGGQMSIAPGATFEQCNYVNSSVPPTKIWSNQNKNPSLYKDGSSACSPYQIGPHPSGDPTWFACYNGQNAIWSGNIYYMCLDNNGNPVQPFYADPNGVACSAVVQQGWKPISAADMEAKVTTQIEQWSQADFLYGRQGDSGLATGVLNDIINSGNGVEVGDSSVTGPATVQGTPQTTTTTDSSGKTTTTTTTNNYNYTYNNPTTYGNVTTNITYNTTVSTVTRNADGTTSTSTTDNAKPQSECELHPQTVGCQELGAPPVAETIPSTDVPVTITSVLFAAPAGCPAPYSGQIKVLSFVKQWSITFDPMCDLMTMLRPLFLATGAAAAAFIFMESMKV